MLISEAEYEATLARADKINTRAARRGFTGRLTVTGTPVNVSEHDPLTGLDRISRMVDVELGGEAPRYGGWTFVASLDWDGEAGLIVRTAPGVDQVDRSTLREGWCDHCRVNRNRLSTYLVRHDDGREVQVGSTCLRDFLGWDGRIVWLSEQEMRDELEEGFGAGAYEPSSHGTTFVLAVAWALIKLDGYRQASSWNGSTKGDVLDVLNPPRNMTMEAREHLARIRGLADEAMQRADECRAWVLSDAFAGHGEYVANLKAIAAADFVTMRNVGILASAPQAWARHQERTLIREADTRPSAWVGTVGERITVTATVEAVRFIESDWGGKVLYTLRDEAGNVYKWFATRTALGDGTGTQVTVKATVKRHDEYQGVQQTVLTRAKVLADVPA